MPFVNIDAPGNRHARRAVNAIQRSPGKADRLSAAQAKRDRRRAKRAGGPGVVILSRMPVGNPPGLCQHDADGAYVWGGNEKVAGRYQIAVAGPLVATVADYGAALAAWLGKPVALISEEPFARPDPDEHPERLYLSLIFEPQPCEPYPDDGIINHRGRRRS